MTVLKVRFGFTGAWVLQGTINGEAAGEGSGKSVTINKNGRVVGIVDDSGYVRVFEFKKKSWKKRGNFAPAQGNISLDKRGFTLAIGATWDNKVRVYDWNGSTWEKRGDDIVVGGGISGWSDSYQRRFSEEQ